MMGSWNQCAGVVCLAFVFSGCGSSLELVNPSASFCAPSELKSAGSSMGSAEVFMLDPISASGNPHLLPNSSSLDSLRSSVALSRLNGTGVLSGSQVEVVNGMFCDFKYGAYHPENKFSYSHTDPRFQEAMAYYYGDSYRNAVDQTGYLQSRGPVTLIAHCEEGDNAYFARNLTSQNVVELVCIYDSINSQGASYGDDAEVLIHELQHATTEDNYSLKDELNQFHYDEAGSLNEAISDFMSLMFSDGLQSQASDLDPRIFSRWALGVFDPMGSHLRGAHSCPVYDSHFPHCDRFPSFEVPSDSNGNVATISYVYPDGLGWPYSNRFSGSDVLLNTIKRFSSQEEIHNSGVLLLGAMWDLYAAIKSNHLSDVASVKTTMTQWVLESLRHLPPANTSTNHSPVTFIGFSEILMSLVDQFPGLTAEDKAAAKRILTARGLYDFQSLSRPDWLGVGSGTNILIPHTSTPGVFIVDDPKILKKWLEMFSQDSSIVSQNLETQVNDQLDPGEVAAIWFDIQNKSNLTAGGVLLTVTSNSSDITILGTPFNLGYMSQSNLNQTQVMYEKINGVSIVSLLNNSENPNSIPIGNSYFNTNLLFNHTPTTAIWVKVSPEAHSGKVVQLLVQATPSNGVGSSQNFPVTIR